MLYIVVQFLNLQVTSFNVHNVLHKTHIFLWSLTTCGHSYIQYPCYRRRTCWLLIYILVSTPSLASSSSSSSQALKHLLYYRHTLRPAKDVRSLAVDTQQGTERAWFCDHVADENDSICHRALWLVLFFFGLVDWRTLHAHKKGYVVCCVVLMRLFCIRKCWWRERWREHSSTYPCRWGVRRECTRIVMQSIDFG